MNGKQSGAYDFAKRQITQWQQWNAQNPDNQVAGPNDDNVGGICLFTYPARPGTHDFQDADWLKRTMEPLLTT